MKKVLVAVLVVVVAMFAGSAFAATHSVMACSTCHVPHDAPAGAIGPLWNSAVAASNTDVVVICTSCHIGSGATTGNQTTRGGAEASIDHPVGVGLGNAAGVTGTMDLTCNSCHFVHATPAKSAAFGKYIRKTINGTDPADLGSVCTQCHSWTGTW